MQAHLHPRVILLGAALLVALLGLAACQVDGPPPPGKSPSIIETPLRSWQARVSGIRWIAYSPTNADPNTGVEPPLDSLREDLTVLWNAGFTGLVTYGASGIVGREVPSLAGQLGFTGLLMGVWDPSSKEEMRAAVSAASNSLVLGYVVGNEGLNKRYDMLTLTSTMAALRKASDKPVTTTEEIDDYLDADLLALGDWVFPNAHPYFHNQTEPHLAVLWTSTTFVEVSRRSGRFVLLKEVGLPTAGAAGLSEENQRAYYRELADTPTRFVHFEAFDMTWKTLLPVEPHWGLFRSDRTPKLVVSAPTAIP